MDRLDLSWANCKYLSFNELKTEEEKHDNIDFEIDWYNIDSVKQFENRLLLPTLVSWNALQNSIIYLESEVIPLKTESAIT